MQKSNKMKSDINNSIVASENSKIINARIKKAQTANERENIINTAITNSIVAESGSQITDAKINIKNEKRKSFWNGFSIGGIITSLIASAIWCFIQQSIEK